MTLRNNNLTPPTDVLEHDKLQSALALIWQEEGHVSKSANWFRLLGGRSNPVWRITSGDIPHDLVCKLYNEAATTPLFANDGTREALVLKHLADTGIAPDFVAFLDSALGTSVLYRHVDGKPWSGAVEDVARLMAKLHQVEAPEGLPESITSPVTLVAETRAMAEAAGIILTPPPPVSDDLPAATRRFLHGDIVPGNIVATENGLRLIDWQCPAIGDPAADIAIFLSPAMQVLYGNRPLYPQEQSAFLKAYVSAGGDVAGATRYIALAPLFHWRMACYCDWKAAHGDAAYRDVAGMERLVSEQG